MDDRHVAALKRAKVLVGGTDVEDSSQKPVLLRQQHIPPLKMLCLNVIVPPLLAKRDRFAMVTNSFFLFHNFFISSQKKMSLGPDIAALVFNQMKKEHILTADTMKLFVHCHLPAVDLSSYHNTSTEFLSSIAQMSVTLTALNLHNCDLISDFKMLEQLKHLELLDLSGTKLNDKNFSHVRGLAELTCLRIGKTFVTTKGVLKILPSLLKLNELDMCNLNLTSEINGTLRKLTNLRSLNLANNFIDLLRINPLKKLAILNVSGCPIVNTSMYWTAGCSNLRSLDISRTSLDAKALIHVKHLPKLENISLPPSSQMSSSEAFNFLSPLTRLTSMNLSRYNVEDLTFMEKMQRLEHVDLSACPVTDLSALQDKAMLQQLVLQYCKDISDASLNVLPKIPNLSALNLSNTPITDKSCVYLADCRNLVTLTLFGDEIGEPGIKVTCSFFM